MDKTDMRQLLEMSITAGVKGAKAAEVSLIRSVVSALVEELPTTVEPTQIVRTVGKEWGAVDSTPLKTPQSSQSDPVDTKSGPVAHDFECVLAYQWTVTNAPRVMGRVQALELHCPVHNVSWFFDKTRVRDVDQTSSTSVKQPSNESVENLVEESATSLLKFMSDGWCPWHQMDYSPSERAVHMLRYPSHEHSLWLKEQK